MYLKDKKTKKVTWQKESESKEGFVCNRIEFEPGYNPGGWLKLYKQKKSGKPVEIAKIYLEKALMLGLIKDLIDEL